MADENRAGLLRRLRAMPGAERRDLLAGAWRLPLAHLCMRLLGIRRSQRLLGRLRSGPGGADSEADPWRRRALALRRVGARLPGVHCLSRSLCLWCWMRRRGLEPRLRIGVRRGDGGVIESHSWVELGGLPVDEAPEVVAQFRVVELGELAPGEGRWRG
jgi:hypothetical protein